MTGNGCRAGDRLLWRSIGAFVALAVGVGMLLVLGNLPKTFLALALVGFALPLVRRRWAHLLAAVVLSGTGAVVLLAAWFAPVPETLDDQLLGIGLPEAGDFAAGVLVVTASLLAVAFALRANGPAPARGWRSGAYAVVGAVSATVLGGVSLAVGGAATDHVRERTTETAFDRAEGPAGAPADLEPAERDGPQFDASAPTGFGLAWTARAQWAVPLPDVGLAVLCAIEPSDEPNEHLPSGTRLSAVDLDTGEEHWSTFIGSPDAGCGFVVDGERNAIALLTGDVAVRLDLATGDITATYELPLTAHGWRVIGGHPMGFEWPLVRAPGYLLMEGEPEKGVQAAAALDFTTGHVRELRRVPARDAGYTWLTADAGDEAALLTSGSCDETALTALDRSGARVAPADTIPLFAGGTHCPVHAALLGSDGTAVVQRDLLGGGDIVSVDTAAGQVRWRRTDPYPDTLSLVELPLRGTFGGRLLARPISRKDEYAMLDADSGEVLQTWTDDTPETRDGNLHLLGWHGSADDAAAYRLETFEEDRNGQETSWRLSWLDPRTLRPADTPLFEMSDPGPDPVAAEGNYLFVEHRGNIMALTADASS
ncbi:hypothetical protein AB0I98_46765 [Streptomyces sp. NPDC050211]|uniref:hypothetical protein n=1 Tax=Streptomyces sp. NPDC050211 TaxID=3154932 RepID=UPI003413FAB5